MNRGILIGAIVILSLLLFVSYNHVETNGSIPNTIKKQFSQEYKIKRIHVMSGDEFDLTLENGRRVHARLAIQTVPNVKSKVVAHINQSTKPSVIVISDGEVWVVDLVFDNVSLTDWLYAQKLVWEN